MGKSETEREGEQGGAATGKIEGEAEQVEIEIVHVQKAEKQVGVLEAYPYLLQGHQPAFFFSGAGL